MAKIVTSEFTISQAVPPSLPQAPSEYQPQYVSQHNNVLRLYFNQISKILDQLKAADAISSDLVTYQPPFTGAVPTTVQNELAQTVSVKNFGASSSATAAENLAAFKLAVAAVQTGGSLVIPADASFYLIDTSGGLSTAVNINKRMQIIFEGDVKSNFGTQQTNPPYIFNVTAENVLFTGGGGKIIGNGTFDTSNSGDETTMPGLVYVAGNKFKCSGLTVEDAPKIGILLAGCTGATITGNIFTGGPTTQGGVANFGIRVWLGGNHAVVGNTFTPSAGGGMCITCIFTNGTTDCTFTGNTALYPYEKFIYIYGNNNIVANNATKGRGNSSLIPGTSQGGTMTSVYRVVGSYNKIINNYSDGCLAGATIQDGVGNEVTGNTFVGSGQLGIAVFNSASYTGGFNRTVIKNNILTGGFITGIVLSNGIYFYSDLNDSFDIDISGNNISNFAAEGILLKAPSPYAVRYSRVSENTIVGGTKGILVDRVTNSIIGENLVRSTSTQGLTETGGAYNKWVNNKCSSAQIGISGLNAQSDSSGNQYTDAPLSGTFTCSAAVTTTVTHGGVAPNARVFLQTANNVAGVMIVAKGWPTPAISGTDFTITMANGTAAAGNEQFWYTITQ